VVAFSPNGTHLVSGSNDDTLLLCDTINGVRLMTLRGHSKGVHSVAFSRDGTRVISKSDDNTLLLWDAVHGFHLKTLIGHHNSVPLLARSHPQVNWSDVWLYYGGWVGLLDNSESVGYLSPVDQPRWTH
jgi:WD40 repeat protein